MRIGKLSLEFIGIVVMVALIACSSPAQTAASSENAGIQQNQATPKISGTPVTTFSEVSLPAGYSVRSSWIDIYFTNPESPLASQETGGIDGPLVEAIDSARLSVDAAIYSISLRSVRDALVHAQHRGVQVRVVMESDNRDRSAPQALLDAGIPVLGDRREGLMHDKFVVIDRSEVWMGSMNFTFSGAYDDNNALLRIRSVKIAENYTQEFNEMFVDDLFGPAVAAKTPNPDITINGTEVETLFSPDDGAAARLLEILEEAKESIYFMAFSFTSDDLGGILRKQAENGLTVAGVMEDEQVRSNIGTEYDPFKQAELDVFLDGNPGLMHHKTMIVDGKIVITGSYNFTKSAETRNDENLVIIHDKQIANFFLQEFQRVFSTVQR